MDTRDMYDDWSLSSGFARRGLFSGGYGCTGLDCMGGFGWSTDVYYQPSLIPMVVPSGNTGNMKDLMKWLHNKSYEVDEVDVSDHKKEVESSSDEADVPIDVENFDDIVCENNGNGGETNTKVVAQSEETNTIAAQNEDCASKAIEEEMSYTAAQVLERATDQNLTSTDHRLCDNELFAVAHSKNGDNGDLLVKNEHKDHLSSNCLVRAVIDESLDEDIHIFQVSMEGEAKRVCKSNLTGNGRPSFSKPIDSCGDSMFRLESTENKSEESNTASTITYESGQQQQHNMGNSSLALSQTSGLLSLIKNGMRKSCVTRQASRVINDGVRQSRGRNSTSGKSSVGSFSNPCFEFRSSASTPIQQKERTPDSRCVTRITNAAKNKIKTSKLSNASTQKVEQGTSNNRMGPNIAKSTYQHTAKPMVFQTLRRKPLRPVGVGEKKLITGTVKCKEKLVVGRSYRLASSGIENMKRFSDTIVAKSSVLVPSSDTIVSGTGKSIEAVVTYPSSRSNTVLAGSSSITLALRMRDASPYISVNGSVFFLSSENSRAATDEKCFNGIENKMEEPFDPGGITICSELNDKFKVYSWEPVIFNDSDHAATNWPLDDYNGQLQLFTVNSLEKFILYKIWERWK